MPHSGLSTWGPNGSTKPARRKNRKTNYTNEHTVGGGVVFKDIVNLVKIASEVLVVSADLVPFCRGNTYPKLHTLIT